MPFGLNCQYPQGQFEPMPSGHRIRVKKIDRTRTRKLITSIANSLLKWQHEITQLHFALTVLELTQIVSLTCPRYDGWTCLRTNDNNRDKINKPTTDKTNYHCRRQQNVESPGNALPPPGSSQHQGSLSPPAAGSSGDHSQPGTAPPYIRLLIFIRSDCI